MSTREAVDADRKSTLVIALAAVFAGMTVVLAVLMLVTRELFVLLLVVPFGATTYFLWYHGTGQMGERLRERAAREARRGPRRETATFGAGPRGDPQEGPRSRFGQRFQAASDRRRQERMSGGPGRGPGGRRAGGRARGPGGGQRDGPSVAEAYDILGVDRDADAETVRTAYRSKVKDVHPDTDGGDEERFKRVNDAYETLNERVL